MQTIDEFIDFFEKTPDGKWNIGVFVKYNDDFEDDLEVIGCCALGHLGCRLSRDGDIFLTENGKNLIKIFEESELFKREVSDWDRCKIVASINDNCHKKYNQETPKERILAALKDIKNAAV